MSPPLRLLLFLTLSSAVSVGTHVYLYRRLFRDTGRHPGWRRLGWGVLAGLCAALLGSRLLTRAWPTEATFAVAGLGWFWMGVATYLLLALLGVGGARRLSGWRRRAEAARAEEPAVSEERREFLARAGAGVAVAAAGGFAGYGVWRAFHPPEVTELAVRLPGLPKALDGVVLVQLSDIHVGPVIQRRFMEALVAQCNGLKPDVVCITGDLVDGSVEELGPSVGTLRGLRSRWGTYFITGNHEYYSGEEAWAEALGSMGVEVLRNRHVPVGEPGASFDLVGVDDWSMRGTGRGYDLKAALAGRDTSRAGVLLAHQPREWRDAARAGMGLQLSGHTHGGQFFPFTLAVSAIWEHAAGHFQEGDSHLYVSRGTGFWGPPLRVASAPEIVKVTLLA